MKINMVFVYEFCSGRAISAVNECENFPKIVYEYLWENSVFQPHDFFVKENDLR